MARKVRIEETEEPEVELEEEEQPKRCGKRKNAEDGESEEPEQYIPDYSSVMDELEKHYGLSAESMDPEARRSSTLSSGTLVTDLIMGGGIFPGGWYTIFGPEQSCKSTQTMTIVGSAAKYDMPMCSISDFEGCLIGETKVVEKTRGSIDIKTVTDLFLEGWPLEILSVSGFEPVVDVILKSKKPITRLEMEGNNSISGYRHPILVIDEQENLVFRLIEDIKIGDEIISKV